MAKSTTLKNKQGERLYPKTTASLTFMSNNVSVEAEINELKEKTKYYKGHFATESALLSEYPNGVSAEESSLRAGWYAVVGETDTIWVWDVQGNEWLNSGSVMSAVTSVNGEVGDVILTGSDINATATVDDSSVTKPISGHLNDIYAGLEDKVTIDTDQIITGTKVFDEVIGLRNVSEGTVDQIKHINSNFLITSGTGENLLNIDEGLETISAFNRQLAFEDEIQEIQGDYVSYTQQTGKTENQKAQARANIGAGTSDLNTVKVNGVAQSIENGEVDLFIPQSIPVVENGDVWTLEEGWYIIKDKVIINGTTYNILSEGVSGAQLLSYVYTIETPSVDYDTKLIYFVNSSKPENGNIDVNTSDASKGTLYRLTNGTYQEIWTVYPRRSEGSVVTSIYVENNVVKMAKDGNVTNLTNIATKQDITNAIPTNYVTTDTTQTITGEKDFTGGLKKNGKTVATEEYVNANGGKIDTISVNNVQQTITNKNVNIEVPTDVSEISTTAQMSAINSGIDSSKVSKIASNEAMIESLAEQVVTDYVPKTRTVNNKSLANNITLTAGDVNALPSDTTYVSSVNGNSGAITGIATTTSVTNVSNRVTAIEGKIPSQATSTNQLADKDFVNSSINSVTAFYITKNAQGDPFSTKAELTGATTYYCGGEVRVPTRNDYAIVLSDETEDNGTTRYIYYNQWEFQYKINETPLTANQLSAINSGITSTLVSKITANETNIAELTQDLNDYVPTSRTINNKPLTNNITLTASDVGALSNDTVIPAVNDGQLTIQKNGTSIGTFTANQSGNSTINITVPTGAAASKGVVTSVDTSSNLPTSNAVKSFVEGKGYITSSASITGNAATATKATGDGNGNNIVNTYATKSALTAVEEKIPIVNDGNLIIRVNNTETARFTANQSGNVFADFTIPSTSSFVTKTGNETISGEKTHSANIVLDNDKYIYTKNSSGTSKRLIGLASNNNLLLGDTATDIIVNSGIRPSTNYSGAVDLGLSTNKWGNIYFSGSLHDGTNSVKVSQIATKTSLNSYATKTELSNYASQPVLLWQNGNPNSAFSGGTITLANSIWNYKTIRIAYKPMWCTYEQPIEYKDFQTKNDYMNIYGLNVDNNENMITSRNISFSNNTSVTFDASYDYSGSSRSVNNNRCIPIAIYGIK